MKQVSRATCFGGGACLCGHVVMNCANVIGRQCSTSVFSKLPDSRQESEGNGVFHSELRLRIGLWRPLTSDLSNTSALTQVAAAAGRVARLQPLLTATSRGRSRGRSRRSGVARSAVRPRDTRSAAERKRRSRRLERSCSSCLVQQGAPGTQRHSDHTPTTAHPSGQTNHLLLCLVGLQQRSGVNPLCFSLEPPPEGARAPPLPPPAAFL